MKTVARLIPVFLCLLLATSCLQSAPIKVTFRESLLDKMFEKSGVVIKVHNLSDKSLSCYLFVQGSGESAGHAFKLEPHANTELGMLEMGWNFQRGHSVEIRVQGYRTSSFDVP